TVPMSPVDRPAMPRGAGAGGPSAGPDRCLGRRPVVDGPTPVLQESAGPALGDRQDLGGDGPSNLLRPVPPEVQAGGTVDHLEVAGVRFESLLAKGAQEFLQAGSRSKHPDVWGGAAQERAQIVLVP